MNFKPSIEFPGSWWGSRGVCGENVATADLRNWSQETGVGQIETRTPDKDSFRVFSLSRSFCLFPAFLPFSSADLFRTFASTESFLVKRAIKLMIFHPNSLHLSTSERSQTKFPFFLVLLSCFLFNWTVILGGHFGKESQSLYNNTHRHPPVTQGGRFPSRKAGVWALHLLAD